MRTQYETSEDLKNENRARTQIERDWGVRLHKLPIAYKLDWVVCRDESIVGWGEFKKRKISINKYNTIMLSSMKVKEMVSYATVVGKAMFFVEFEEGLYFTEISPSDSRQGMWGGRTWQRRDNQDEEPVILIPVKNFRKVETPQ